MSSGPLPSCWRKGLNDIQTGMAKPCLAGGSTSKDPGGQGFCHIGQVDTPLTSPPSTSFCSSLIILQVLLYQACPASPFFQQEYRTNKLSYGGYKLMVYLAEQSQMTQRILTDGLKPLLFIKWQYRGTKLQTSYFYPPIYQQPLSFPTQLTQNAKRQYDHCVLPREWEQPHIAPYENVTIVSDSQVTNT